MTVARDPYDVVTEALGENAARRASLADLSSEDILVCLDALNVLRHSQVPAFLESRETYERAFEVLADERLHRDVEQRRGGEHAGHVGELQALGKYPPPHMRRRRNELIRSLVRSGEFGTNQLARLIDMSPGQVSRIVNHISPVREDR